MSILNDLREKTTVTGDDLLYIDDSETAVGSTYDAKIKWSTLKGDIPTYTSFVPSNSGSTGQYLQKTSSGYQWATIPTYTSFAPANTGSTGQLLTKTSGGYNWQDAPTTFSPSNTGTTGQYLQKTSTGYQWATIPTYTSFAPGSGSTGQILTKTATGYGWADAPAAGGNKIVSSKDSIPGSPSDGTCIEFGAAITGLPANSYFNTSGTAVTSVAKGDIYCYRTALAADSDYHTLTSLTDASTNPPFDYDDRPTSQSCKGMGVSPNGDVFFVTANHATTTANIWVYRLQNRTWSVVGTYLMGGNFTPNAGAVRVGVSSSHKLHILFTGINYNLGSGIQYVLYLTLDGSTWATPTVPDLPGSLSLNPSGFFYGGLAVDPTDDAPVFNVQGGSGTKGLYKLSNGAWSFIRAARNSTEALWYDSNNTLYASRPRYIYEYNSDNSTWDLVFSTGNTGANKRVGGFGKLPTNQWLTLGESSGASNFWFYYRSEGRTGGWYQEPAYTPSDTDTVHHIITDSGLSYTPTLSVLKTYFGGSGGGGSFSPSNTGSTGQYLVKTASGYNWADAPSGTFSPTNTGSTGQVLTKTATGYSWQAASGGSFSVHDVSATGTTIDDADYLVFSDESATNDVNTKITWANLKAALPSSTVVATYTTLPDEGATWQDLPGTWADTDLIRVRGVAQAAAGTAPLRTIDVTVVVGNIRANSNNNTAANRLWLIWGDPSGARLQIRRKLNASTTLQICEAGPVATTDMSVEVIREVE